MKAVIVVDGVVGAGKTSLVENLSPYLGLPAYQELTHRHTLTLLDKYYENPSRWAYTLQTHFLIQRFELIKTLSVTGRGLLDRSIFGDSVFAEMLYEDGYMQEEEYLTYQELLKTLLSQVIPGDLLIYLHCRVQTAITRIKARDRGLEKKVPNKYWYRLGEKYANWYDSYSLSPKMAIDTDQYNVHDPDFLNFLVTRIKEKLSSGNSNEVNS